MKDNIEKKSLSAVLCRYGLSRSLLWIVLACGIWGLFPWFITGGVRTLSEKFPTAYIFLRYLSATLGFWLVLVLLNMRCNKTSGIKNFIIFFRNYLWRLVFMAIVISLARWFEIKGYMNRDGWGDYKDFSIIYSILLITIWDCKSWLPSFLIWLSQYSLLNKLRLYRIGNALKDNSFTKPFFLPLPNATELFVWVAKCILIICSGFFLLYVLLGKLPPPGSFFFKITPSGIHAGPMSWALCSAFCTALFFDQMLWFRGEIDFRDMDTMTIATHVQLGVAIIICFPFVGWYGFEFLSDLSVPSAELSSILAILDSWAAPEYCKFFVGLVILGTVIAFILEYYGAAAHDQKKKKEGIKARSIKGREWLSVTTSIDPIVANIALIFMGVTVASGWWMGMPIACIFAVGLLSLVLLWSKKADEIRREVFSGELLSSRGLDIKAKNLTRLLLYGDCGKVVNILREKKSSKYFTIQEDTLPRSISENEKYIADFLGNCQRLLSQLSKYPQGMRPFCSMFFLQNGQEWFSSYNLEGKVAFDNHLKAILDGTGNRIFRLEEILTLLDKFKWTGVDVPFEKTRILDAIKCIIKEQQLYTIDKVEHDNIKEVDCELLLPLILYNEANPALQIGEAASPKALIIADGKTLTEYWSENALRNEEIENYLKVDFEDFFLKACKHGWNFSDIIYDIHQDQNTLFLQEDPYPEANWLFFHASFLRRIFESKSQSIPVWMHQKRVVFFYYDWMLPQSRLALGMSDKASLPELNLAKLNDTKVYPEEAIGKVLQMAEYRFQKAPELIIIDDDQWKREEHAENASVALIGTNGTIRTPQNLIEAESFIETTKGKGHFSPLVFLDFDFSKWYTEINGLSFIRPYYKDVDPWLFTLKGKIRGVRSAEEKSFPEDKQRSIDKITISKIIAWHTGVRLDHTPWSTNFLDPADLLSSWEELLVALNNEKRDGSSNAYCHGLFLNYAENRKTKLDG